MVSRYENKVMIYAYIMRRWVEYTGMPAWKGKEKCVYDYEMMI